jgi:hypothetical protein
MSVRALAVALVLLGVAPIRAAVPAPPPPDVYEVEIRYLIDAYPKERVPRYRALMKHLKDIGFQRDDDSEEDLEAFDRRLTRLRGTIPSEKAPPLFGERSIQTVRLLPKGTKPLTGDEPVRVHLELASGLGRGRQPELTAQLRAVLANLGFREGVGYDERGGSRLVGSLPGKNVDALIDDIRLNPAAWTLLQPSLLADLRNSAAGAAILEAVIDDWRGRSDGRKRVEAMIDDWRRQPAAAPLIATLPAKPALADELALREKLLQQLLRHRDAGPALTQLFKEVLQEKAAPELMALLLRRLSGQEVGDALPLLFRVSPTVRLIEALPGTALPSVRPAPPEIKPEQRNISEDLRAVIADAAAAEKPIRFEVLLAETPESDRTGWRRPLLRAGLAVEGRLGPLVTVTGLPAQAAEVAQYDEVASVRLPRPARPQPLEGLKPIPDDPLPLRASGLVRLWAMGAKGKGQRVAVIDSDFRGWEGMLGKELPATTKLIDLTRARNTSLQPDSFEGDPGQLGLGTLSAAAVHRAAPEAEITLIRVDDRAPYLVQAAADAINGGPGSGLLISIDERIEELARSDRVIAAEEDRLLIRRKAVFDVAPAQDDEDDVPWKSYRQDNYLLNLAKSEYRKRTKRLQDLQRDLRGLKGVRVVTSGLVWGEGHPVDGGSTLSRWFDDRPFGAALWFQSAGDTRGQAWSGLFRDDDRSGVMDFAAAGERLPSGAWSPKLNFLAWQPRGGKTTPELPETTLRLSLQWREPHEADPLLAGEDPYREPLFSPRLVVFRQFDPDGKMRPADDLEVVVQSVGAPQRLEQSLTSAVYEQSVTLTVAAPGRYALWVEGVAPTSIRPRGAPTLPTVRKFGDLRPRLYAQTLTGAGRAVWRDFATDAGTLGMPADARRVLTVGAADGSGKARAASANGPALGLELLPKPDLLAMDGRDAEEGTETVFAGAYAAGLAACSQNVGASVGKWAIDLGLRPGGLLRLPERWRRE